jgi:hypothetical protein
MGREDYYKPRTQGVPCLVGVVHLPPLPGSPRFSGELDQARRSAAQDARALAEAGFDAVLVENFGDAPFLPAEVAPITVASMTACALAAREAAPGLSLGINVLRNDAQAALAVAVASSASFVRINVHVGARVTDQGIVQGEAHRTLRARRELGAEHVLLLCDVDVKHSAPLGSRPLADEARDLTERGLADAVLVTGSGTGRGTSTDDLEAVSAAVQVPVLVASGVTEVDLGPLRGAHGVIVGSTLRASGRAGDPIDLDRAKQFARAFREAWSAKPG